jgi:hypothetical protein
VFYGNGQLMSVSKYRNDILVDTAQTYFRDTQPSKVKEMVIWKDETVELRSYYKIHGIQSRGSALKLDLKKSIGKWTLVKKDIDSVVEYVDVKNSTYAERHWILNKKGDTL